VEDARTKDVVGLSHLNQKLLKQRGAVGEPVNRLREAGKKVATMGSVISKLKSTLAGEEQDSPTSSDPHSAGSSYQQKEQEEDAPWWIEDTTPQDPSKKRLERGQGAGMGGDDLVPLLEERRSG
jgi:hypothetical protein